MISLIRELKKKHDTNELIYRTKIDFQAQKTIVWVAKGKGRRGINLMSGINVYTLLFIKQINNKGLLYSTGRYIQYLIITYNAKKSEKNIRLYN